MGRLQRRALAPLISVRASSHGLEDLNFPEIKRKKQEERKEEDKKEFKELFELDTDSDEENGFTVKGKGRATRESDDSSEASSKDFGEDEHEDEGRYEVEEDEEELEEDSDSEEEAQEAARVAQGSQKQRRCPRGLSRSDLEQLAQGEEDLVQDLALSDED